ncbi:MAG TPA: gliding motility lipoprotein GldH [Saprospiraceae bacterium]|nr:gliding motility lipoprotein GldH [Saprospiraceae bacterium]
MRAVILGVIFLLGLSACRHDIMVRQKWKWNDHQWINGDTKTITLNATDTLTVYAMDLDLNWEKDYGFENLYIRTKTVFPSGKIVTSITSLEMAEKDGSWAGRCGGHACKLQFPLQKKFTFPEIGQYSWSIEPYMRVDTVKGINSLQVTCRKIGK